IDIMNNERGILGEDGPARMVTQGVYETLVERDMLGDEHTNTSHFGTDFTVVTDLEQIPDRLSDEARHNLGRDLAAGYVALLPSDGDTWWRVDASSGATVGVGADARGVSLT